MWNLQLLVTFLAAFFTLAASLPNQRRQGLGVKITNADSENLIEQKYIVVLNSSNSASALDSYTASVTAHIKKRNLRARHLTEKRQLSTDVAEVNMGAWRCLILEAEDTTINSMADSDMVNWIEGDTVVKTTALLEQKNGTAGLARISHAAVGAQNYVFDDSAGQGVTVYVVDTGVKATHSEFGGRAVQGANFVGDNINDDGNGHGSHVSGTVAGTNFGVAKKANIVGVKVLGSDGSGANSAVLQGVSFVAQDAKAKNAKAVMNMSLGGGVSRALNAAVAQLAAQGVVPVVAAGNENQDTANTSPGSAPDAITVGAIDQRDARASFSNFGPSVDIFAPGVQVLSVGITSNTATAVLSGTSMASPHVAGMVAVMMSTFPELTNAAQVRAKMVEFAGATGASVRGLTARQGNTTTLIAYNGSGQ